MALFGFNSHSHRYEMLMSVCFTCLCNSTTANFIALAILIGTYQLVNDIRYVPAEVMPASVFAALHSRAPGQSSTSGTVCHTVLVGSRIQLQQTVSAGTGSRGVSCLKLKKHCNKLRDSSTARENHLRECSRLVGEDVLDLAELFIESGRSRHGRRVFGLEVHVPVPVDPQTVNEPYHLHAV